MCLSILTVDLHSSTDVAQCFAKMCTYTYLTAFECETSGCNYLLSFNILYAVTHMSQHLKLVRDVSFPFRLTISQPLLGADLLLHSML